MNQQAAAKHTPGPWANEYDGALVMGGQVVAQPSSLAPDTASREERLANARLIAAAPELLAALTRAAALLARYPKHDAAWQQATDAIAKAEGRS